MSTQVNKVGVDVAPADTPDLGERSNEVLSDRSPNKKENNAQESQEQELIEGEVVEKDDNKDEHDELNGQSTMKEGDVVVKEGGCSPELKDCVSSAGVCLISLIIISFIWFSTRGVTPCAKGEYAEQVGPELRRLNCLKCEENCAQCQEVTGKCYECIPTHRLDDDKKCVPACTGNKPGKWNPRTEQCDCENGLVTLRDSCLESCPADISLNNETNACTCADGFKVGDDYRCTSICDKANEHYDPRWKKCICQGLEVDERCELHCAEGEYYD